MKSVIFLFLVSLGCSAFAQSQSCDDRLLEIGVMTLKFDQLTAGLEYDLSGMAEALDNKDLICARDKSRSAVSQMETYIESLRVVSEKLDADCPNFVEYRANITSRSDKLKTDHAKISVFVEKIAVAASRVDFSNTQRCYN